MPNVPLARELDQLAPEFARLLSLPIGDVTGPKLTRSEVPECMYDGVDTCIFVRARPILSHEADRDTTVRRVDGMRNCIFMSPEVTVAGKTSVVPTSIPVDATFVNSDTNEAVYATTCSGFVSMAANGGSASLLCYGQTGSGKTFTTTGLLRCVSRDIEPAMRSNPHLIVSVTFIEVRAEGCRDLITGDPSVQILEDKTGVVQVLNARDSVVTTAAQIDALCTAAIAARSTKSTERNQEGSSRSHMAVRFLFRRADAPWAAPGVLCFVDLAGSESAADAVGHDKERIMETRFINSSLMTLKECIRARGEACVTTKHVHVPFRQSKLTLLLRDSFETVVQRQTKTAMIASVSPLLRDARHTYNTLRYAALLYVSPKAGVVVEAHPKDPSTWSRDDALVFIREASGGRIRQPEAILTAGDGRALVSLPEELFVERAVALGMSSKAAKEVYTKIWKVIIDAKQHVRAAMKKAKDDAIARREAAKSSAVAARALQQPAAPERSEELGAPENDDYLHELTRRMATGRR